MKFREFLTNKWTIRALMILCLSALCLLANALLGSLERESRKPREIVFTLPLPDGIASKYGIGNNPDIDRVVLSGFFSDWDPDNTDFAMRRVSPDRWAISQEFEPGDNQYKFVIYTKDGGGPFWVQDAGSKVQVPDGFGGFNSVIRVPDFALLSLLSNSILFGLLALLALYCLMEPVLVWILHRKMSFRYKLVFSMVFIGVIANAGLIAYNIGEQKEMARQGLVDGINLVHNFLLGEGVDFSALNGGPAQTNIQDSIRKFFWKARTRVEKNKHSNIQIPFSSLVVLDTNFHILALQTRRDNADQQLGRAISNGFTNLEDYFRNGVLKGLIGRLRTGPVPKELSTGAMDAPLMRFETPQTRTALFLLGFNTFLYPITSSGKITGYYGGDIQVKLLGLEVRRVLAFNIYLLAVITILAVMLLLSAGRLITNNLNELAAWTQKIISGDFNQERHIKSNDEIQLLAENFNMMRIGLKNSFAEIEEHNRRLLVEAYIDKLTGLNNRKRLLADLEAGKGRALLLFNIDSFQEINDFFGNEVGDFILMETAKRFQGLLMKQGQLLYKIGADEYVVLIEKQHDRKELEVMAVYFCDGIMDNSYHYLDNEIYVSITAGLSAYPPSAPARTGKENRALLAMADMALIKAKKTQSRYLVYDDSMEITREYELNILWTNKLKNALKEGRIVPFYQPIISNKSGRIEKYECLARMVEPDGSIITPDNFLKISKKARFYRFITKSIIEKSMDAFSGFNYEFSINLSIEDILDERTCEFLFGRLKGSPDIARRMVFEIVETEGIENYELVKQFISQIKVFGAKIAIDDFGSGYSNFEHILQLNVDYIKIDAALIKNMDNDTSSQVITRTISRFAVDLNIGTIAEYVHSKEIYDKVLEYGIDYSQGYYFSEPKPTIR